MKCPNPKCDNESMKLIVDEEVVFGRWQKRFICHCGAYVQLEYDLFEV